MDAVAFEKVLGFLLILELPLFVEFRLVRFVFLFRLGISPFQFDLFLKGFGFLNQESFKLTREVVAAGRLPKALRFLFSKYASASSYFSSRSRNR